MFTFLIYITYTFFLDLFFVKIQFKDIIVLTEPTTPLNNADHGGSFYLFKGKFKLNLEKDQFKVKPPKTYKEQIKS